MKIIHPLLRWTLYGWLLSALMAAIVLLFHRHLSWHGAALGISAAYLVRIVLGKGREANAFHKMAHLLVGGGASSTSRMAVGMGLFLLHLLLCLAALVSLPPLLASATLFSVIPFSRMAACQLAQMLPYRGKSPLAPSPYSVVEGLLLFALGVLPACFLWWCATSLGYSFEWSWMLFASCVVLYGLYLLLASRLRGYTYDGLVFVAAMLEIAFLLAMALTL